MTRLYNDHSTIARDHAELNLNSVNFSKFHFEQAGDAGQIDAPASSRIRAKDSVLRLARYEKLCGNFVSGLDRGDGGSQSQRDEAAGFLGIIRGRNESMGGYVCGEGHVEPDCVMLKLHRRFRFGRLALCGQR